MKRWVATALVVAGVLGACSQASADVLCDALARAGAHVPLGTEKPEYRDAFKGPVGEMNWNDAAWARPYWPSNAHPKTPLEVLAGLSQILEAAEQSTAWSEGNRLRDRLIAELERLLNATEQQASRRSFDWESFVAEGGLLTAFEQLPRTAQCNGKKVSTDTLFFYAGDAPDPLLLQSQSRKAIEGGLEVDDGEPRYYASLRQAVEFRAAVDAVKLLFAAPLTASLERGALRLSQVNAGWTNYLAYGFSQYPWEAFLNSWGLTWHEAPRTQLVFVHPELAVVIDARSTEGSAISGSLLVHGLGLIVYGGKTRKAFIGASGTGAITTSSALGLGAGATLHFGHTALHSRAPHVSLSLLYFDTSSGKPGPFFGVSVDVWRLFQGDNNESIFRNALLR